jgi:hypothetical protein
MRREEISSYVNLCVNIQIETQAHGARERANYGKE